MTNESLLEEIVKQKRNALSCKSKVDKDFNNSFNEINYLDGVLRSEFPVRTAAFSYSHPDEIPYMNDVLKDYVNARDNGIAANVNASLKEYVAKADRINDATLEKYAFTLDEKYRKIIESGNDESGVFQLIAEYAGDNGKCIRQIELSRNPEKALEMTYSAIVKVEQQTIANREGFLDYGKDKEGNDTVSLNRKNIEKYVLDKTDKSSDAIKKNAYIRFADLYVN